MYVKVVSSCNKKIHFISAKAQSTDQLKLLDNLFSFLSKTK